MSTIYFGCTTLSQVAPQIQLHQERDCTQSPASPLGTSATASPGHAGGDSPMDGVRLPQGCAVEGMIAATLAFTLAEASPASLAAQHPACMRQSRIAICHRNAPWLPIRPFTWGPKPAFKCLTSETPACTALLKHFHHRNLHNLQSQQ